MMGIGEGATGTDGTIRRRMDNNGDRLKCRLAEGRKAPSAPPAVAGGLGGLAIRIHVLGLYDGGIIEDTLGLRGAR